jgi:hypothetical protein
MSPLSIPLGCFWGAFGNSDGTLRSHPRPPCPSRILYGMCQVIGAAQRHVRDLTEMRKEEPSVLNGHGVRINGFLTGNAFESGQDASVFVLVALHCQAAFFVTVGPC